MKFLKEYIKLIEAYCGLRFPETHYKYITDAVENEITQRTITEEQYLLKLWENHVERDRLFDQITINETYMFREERHFHIVKKLLESDAFQMEKKIQCWSVTCSTGEEAISLALLAQELVKKPNVYSVYATDINAKSLHHLRSGLIHQSSFRLDGSGFMNLIEKYTLLSENTRGVLPEVLHKIVSFKKNLLSDTFQEIPDNSIHIAFFRNTLVYMEESVKNKMIETVVPKLRDGGYLFLSSPEVPLIQHPQLHIESDYGCFYFKKENISLSSNSPKNALVTQSKKREIAIRSKQEPTTKNLLNIKQVLLILNGEVKTAGLSSQNTNTVIANLIKKTLHNIHKNDLTNAKLNLAELEKTISDHELVYFLKGLFFYSEGNYKVAIQNFELSLLTNHKLWMSSFYLGLIVKLESPNKAIKYFKNVITELEIEIQNKKFLYLFLMDNFDALYFLQISQNWIDKLSAVKE